jgi:hypothetical protein
LELDGDIGIGGGGAQPQNPAGGKYSKGEKDFTIHGENLRLFGAIGSAGLETRYCIPLDIVRSYNDLMGYFQILETRFLVNRWDKREFYLIAPLEEKIPRKILKTSQQSHRKNQNHGIIVTE